jgi:hypothetical protein
MGGISKMYNLYYKPKKITNDELLKLNNELLNKRKWIEKKIADIFIREKNVSENRIYRIHRNQSGRILAYSPYTLNMDTNHCSEEWMKTYFNILSKDIHKCIDERYIIELEINKIIPITDTLVFRFFNFISPYLEDRDRLVRYCNLVKIPMPSKEDVKKVKSLIYRWREVSVNCHHKMTKQEKRKLKKLNKRTIEAYKDIKNNFYIDADNNKFYDRSKNGSCDKNYRNL